MRSINKYICFLAIVLALPLASCEEDINLQPYDAVETGDALQSGSDFTNAMRGVYSRFRQGTYYGGWYLSLPDILSDNLIISSEGRTSKQSFYYWNYTGNLTWTGLWENAYVVVNRSNLILENIDALQDGDFKNNVKGEALALRALAHFDLARVFAEIPAVATGSELGVPYITSSDASQKPDRSTVTDTYANILADFTEAKGLIATDNGVGRLNRTAVDALLSRVYLYMGNDAKVIETATSAIEAGGNVASREEFRDIWVDETEAGVIFKVLITEQDNSNIGTEYSQTGASGVRSEYVAEFDFYQSYAEDDVRKEAYFSTSEFAGKDFNHISKYFGRATGSANRVDAKVIRWAEVYLNRAEAYANLNQDAEALADLNEIRKNRYVDFVSVDETGQALKDAIAAERRKELAFEGHRFFDLKRKGLPVVRSTFGDEADGGGVPVPEFAMVLPAESFKFLLPIPQDEINANDNIKQNPGY